MSKTIKVPYSLCMKFILPKNLKHITNSLHISTSPGNQTL